MTDTPADRPDRRRKVGFSPLPAPWKATPRALAGMREALSPAFD